MPDRCRTLFLRLLPLLSLLLLTALPPAGMALAGDHYDLEEDLPIRVEDAMPTPFMNREVQTVLRYQREDNKKDLFYGQPRVAVGIWPNTELRVGVPLRAGTADKRGSGDIEASLLYNFNQEARWFPALAVEGKVDIPTGYNSRGWDTEVKFIATKTLGETSYFHQLHVNLSWLHNDRPDHRERENGWVGVVGYSMRVGPDLVLLADVWREWKAQKDKKENMVEAGLRYMWSPRVVLSLGGGVGFADQSPPGRVTTGVQVSF